MSTFDKNTIQNQCFLMESLINTSFLTTFESASGSAGFARWENICFLKSDRQKSVQNYDFCKKHNTKAMLFDEKFRKHIVFRIFENASGSAGFPR